MATTNIRFNSTKAAMAADAQTQTTNPAGHVVGGKDGSVLMELARLKRWVSGGRLYLKGEIYECTKSQAETMLEEEFEGIPIWRRYKGAAEGTKTVVVERVPKDIRERVLVPLVASGKAIEIGTDEEMRELGLDMEGAVTI